jgi:hypothetical protein
MSVSTESCYECGSDIPDGLGEAVYACLWDMPGAGGQHWAWVPACPSCAGARRRRRAALLIGAALLVSALTALVVYPLLP